MSDYFRKYLKGFPACEPPSDAVSALEFTPKTATCNWLCAASLDKTVRIWEVDANNETTTPKCLQKLSAPLLDVSWNGDGNRIYASDVAGSVHEWNLDTNNVFQKQFHSAGVRACHWLWTPWSPLLMTASFDKTVKFWDIRNPQPVASFGLPERCLAADVLYPLAVVACADQNIISYSLENGPFEMSREDLTKSSELQTGGQQVRAIAVFQSNQRPTGYVAVTTKGLMHVRNIPDNTEIRKNCDLKCHHQYSTDDCSWHIHAVNDVRVHPIHQSIATVGSDKKFHFWKKGAPCSIYSSTTMAQTITKCAISGDGQLFAYALGYDWYMGHEHCAQNRKSEIFLYHCLEPMNPD